MVSSLSIGLMIMNAAIGIIIPLALLIFFKVKYKASIMSFVQGFCIMFIFAFLFEQYIHLVVFSSPVGDVLNNNIFLYALYGGLMAGLFEETGRLLTMKFLLMKQHDNRYNALMYGAGHGGFEMVVILAIGMITTVSYAFLINNGQMEAVMASLEEADRLSVESEIQALISVPAWQFVMSPIERISAMIAQLALSVIVWHGAVGEKIRWKYYIIAIVMHCVLDMVAVILNRNNISIILVEVVVFIIAIGYVFIARNIWKREEVTLPETN